MLFQWKMFNFKKSEFGKIVVDCLKPHDFNPLCSDNLTQSFDFNRSFIILCWKLLLYVQLCSLWQNTQCRQKGRKNSWTRSHQLTLIMRKLQNIQKELKNQQTYYFIAQNKILKVCQILHMSNVVPFWNFYIIQSLLLR